MLALFFKIMNIQLSRILEIGEIEFFLGIELVDLLLIYIMNMGPLWPEVWIVTLRRGTD